MFQLLPPAQPNIPGLEALCLLGMSWMGMESSLLKAAQIAGTPVSRSLSPQWYPGRVIWREKAPGQICAQWGTPSEQQGAAHALPSPSPGAPAHAGHQGRQWWLGPWTQAPVWSTLTCSESYFFACGPTSPRSQSPPVTAWHRNWCLHIFSLFLSFFPFPQTIQATCLLILCFLLVSALSPAMVMKLLLLLILFVVL